MKVFFAIIVIAVIAVLGSRFSFSDRRIPLGVRTILLTGTEYIFLGALLGRSGLDLLDRATLKALEPALLFGLAWVGFLIGLQFNSKEMRKLPHFYFSITALQSLFTFLVVAGCAYWLLGPLAPIDDQSRVSVAAVLGATASCTSPSALAIIANRYKFTNRKTAGLLRYISGVDGLFGVVLFGVAVSLGDGFETFARGSLGVLRNLAIAVVMGVAPGLVLVILNQTRFRHHELILFLIGTLMYCAGLAAFADHSPLVAGLICGVIFANWGRHRNRSLNLVQHAEHSIYVILLLLVGAAWELHIDYSLVLMIGYFVLRAVGKVVGAFVATRLLRLGFVSSPLLGLGLIPGGGLAIAMVISFGLISEGPLVNVLITIIVLSVLLSELIGGRVILSVFAVTERRHAK